MEQLAGKSDYAVVVSIGKSGTNLVARLMSNLGYKCVGQGLRDSYAELWDKLQGNDRQASPKNGFLHPDKLLDVLKTYPKYTCLFVHSLEIGPHLLEWCTEGTPKLLFNYRDPRDTILSLINYLLRRANDHFTESAWNMVHERILADMTDGDEQIMFAIKHMEKHTNRFREHVWLLYHPLVCKISYEDLVGPSGGGDLERQRSTVAAVMRHLGLCPEAPSVTEGLYDPSARTFHRGCIRAWASVFKEEHRREFEARYGDILIEYGYA